MIDLEDEVESLRHRVENLETALGIVAQALTAARRKEEAKAGALLSANSIETTADLVSADRPLLMKLLHNVAKQIRVVVDVAITNEKKTK